MKKNIIRLAIIFVAASFLAGCVKEEINSGNGSGIAEGTEFTISLDLKTKTANDGLNTVWVEGDKVNVFHAVSGTQDYIDDGVFEFTSGSSFSGKLTGALESGTSYDWYVAYPYDKDMHSPKSMNINVPSDQYQSEDGSMAHLCGSLCPLAGKASGLSSNSAVSVRMKPLVTVMKIKVTNYEANPMDLSLVSFMANGCTHENETVTLLSGMHEKTITGSYTVDFTGEKISYTQVDKGNGTGTPRPLLHLQTSKRLGLNESATVYLATIPFYIANATSLTIGMNNNEGGIEQYIYGKNVACGAGQICGVKQGSRLAPPFKDGINFYIGVKNADGSYSYEDRWRCDLPSDFQFSGEFSFTELFTTFNSDAWIDITEVGSGNQNDLVRNEYDAVAACIESRVAVSDGGGVWSKNGRWNSNFNVNWANDKNGVFLKWYGGYQPTGPVASWYIWFRIQDPFADKFIASNGVNRLRNDAIDNFYLFGQTDAAEHTFTRIGWVTGGADIAKDIHINTQYNTATNDYTGGNLATFKTGWMVENHLMSTDGRLLIKNDLNSPYSFGLTEEAQKYCRFSRGLYWIPAAFIHYSSPTNATEYEKRSDPESRTGEKEIADLLSGYGVTIIDSGHIMLADDYDTTQRFCIIPRIKFEYDYGTIVYTYGSRYLPGLSLNI